MQRYSRGPKEVAIFTEFPGKKTPIASEGPEWRLARKAMLYVALLTFDCRDAETLFCSPIFTVKSFTEHVSLAMEEVSKAVHELYWREPRLTDYGRSSQLPVHCSSMRARRPYRLTGMASFFHSVEHSKCIEQDTARPGRAHCPHDLHAFCDGSRRRPHYTRSRLSAVRRPVMRRPRCAEPGLLEVSGLTQCNVTTCPILTSCAF